MKAMAIIGVTIAVMLQGDPAFARDPFEGDWARDCGPELQCWIEIGKTGPNRYAFVFKAADRMDAASIRCKVEATMRRNGNAIAGTLQRSGRAVIRLERGGAVKLNGAGRCADLPMDGRYRAFADE